jgi:hypothetical protein
LVEALDQCSELITHQRLRLAPRLRLGLGAADALPHGGNTWVLAVEWIAGGVVREHDS